MHPNLRWDPVCVRKRWTGGKNRPAKTSSSCTARKYTCSLNLGYRIINADEAVAILERCRDAGLVHSLDFCMQSGRWHFVICNCDRDICVLVRVFLDHGENDLCRSAYRQTEQGALYRPRSLRPLCKHLHVRRKFDPGPGHSCGRSKVSRLWAVCADLPGQGP